MNGVGSDFRQKDCEIRESKLEVSQLIHKPLRYAAFGLSMTDVGDGDLALRAKEFVVFEVGRQKDIGPTPNGVGQQKTACAPAQRDGFDAPIWWDRVPYDGRTEG